MEGAFETAVLVFLGILVVESAIGLILLKEVEENVEAVEDAIVRSSYPIAIF